MTAAFLLTSLLLAVTPGPGVVYIVGRSMVQGRAAGVASACGVAAGNAANAVGASLGLAALFAALAAAFTAVKLAGAAYLVWLGLRLLRGAAPGSPAETLTAEPLKETARLATLPLARLFRDGLLVAVLNPKTTLFFAAFLPQFMHVGEPALPQAASLAAAFVAIAMATDIAYAVLASAMGARLASAGTASRWGRRVSAVALIGLGVFTAASPAPACSGRLSALPPC